VLLLLVNGVLILKAEDSKPRFSSVGGHVLAQGQWKPSSGKVGDDFGKHAVEIQCRLEIKACFEAKAEIVGQEPQVFLQEYRVIEWDKNGIIAEDDSPICSTNRLLINFQEQSVTAIDTPKKDAKGMPLADGKNVCQLANYTRIYTLTK
jgi:hypothetical protein